jgi:general secretion pathway protein J
MTFRSRRREAGFTLIELLVSLALLALLTTVLLAGFRFATQPLQRQAGRFEEAAALPVVDAFLRARLADAQPIVPINGEADAVAFDGRPSRVDFVAAAPQGAALGGLYLYSIDVASGKLRARWRLFAGLMPAADEDAGDTALLDGVRRIDFAYFGARISAEDVAWRDQWRDVPYLPLLIRFEFVMANGERVPALVVAPRLRPLRAVPIATAPSETQR